MVDTCVSLTAEQLGTSIRGTYGSILETMCHLAGGDASYLFVLTGGRVPEIDEDHMDLAELRTAMEGNGAAWSSLLAAAQTPCPSGVLLRPSCTERCIPAAPHDPLSSWSD